MVWLDTPETEAERRRHDGMDANLIRQHMTPRKAPRAPAWKWSGRAMSNTVDPTRLSVAASMYAQRRVVGPGRSAATDISPA